MKKYITLMALFISFFNPAHGMEAGGMDIDSLSDDSSIFHPINIEQKKQAILEIFKSQPKTEGLVGLFSNLLNVFTGPDFNNISSTPFRLQLMQFIKEQVKNFYEFDNREPEILTQELQILVKKRYKGGDLLHPDTINDILHLIISGANPNVRMKLNEYGEFPLLNFLIWGSQLCGYSENEHYEKLKDLIFCLLIFGADMNYSTSEVHSPLYQAASYKGILAEIIKVLVIFGADVNQIGMFGGTIISQFFLRVLHKNKETHMFFLNLIKLVLNYGYKINPINPNGTFLLTYCFKEALELLINHGIDINAQSKDGSTILHEAVDTKNPELVETLLKHGADIHLTNDQGEKAYDRIFDSPMYAQIYAQIEKLFEQYCGIKFVDVSSEGEDNNSSDQQKTSFMDADFSKEEKEKSDQDMAESSDEQKAANVASDAEIIEQHNLQYQLTGIDSSDSDLDYTMSDNSVAFFVTDEQQLELKQFAESLYQKISDLTISEEERNFARAELLKLFNFKFRAKC